MDLVKSIIISINLTQMNIFPTRISDFWILFLSSDAKICSTMTSPPLGRSGHVIVSVSIDFPSRPRQDDPFYCVAYDHSRTASVASSEFGEWVQVGINVYILHPKYQVKPHSSPWFSVNWTAAIVHRNHLFRLYQQNKSSAFKAKFRQASNPRKRIFEAAKLAYANKTKESITSQ